MLPLRRSEPIDVLSQLEGWYARDAGQQLLASTRRVVGDILDTAFGYHLLQTGCSRGHALFDSSPINHRIYAAEKPGAQISLLALADELPFENDSIDVLIAHHTLDFAPNPHQVLREMQRVLTPQGQLLVVGFNPHSPLGVAARLRALRSGSLWRQHGAVSERRLTDWLHLLGCEVQESIRLCAVPRMGGAMPGRWLGRLEDWSNRHNLPWGGLYVVHAVKQVGAVLRPRRSWPLRKARLIGLVPKPAPAPTPTPYRPVGNGAARRNRGEGVRR